MSGRAPKTYPSFEKLEKAAHQIVALAHRQGVPVALCGGLAMQMYGSPRLTADVDVVASSDITGLPEVARLSFGGQWLRAPNEVDVDVVVRADDYAPLYAEALLDAVERHPSGIPVVSPEYLVAMKMVADRDRDHSDVRFLVLLDGLDMTKTEAIVKEHLGRYGVQALRSFVAEAKWRRDTGKE